MFTFNKPKWSFTVDLSGAWIRPPLQRRCRLHITARKDAALRTGQQVAAHQFPLVAEAESADGPRRGRAERRGAVRDAPVAETRLSVPAVLPEQQHVGQVRDVAGGQAQRLYLGELPVHGLGGDERAERREGRVHAVRPATLPRVGRLPLFVRTGAALVSCAAASPPPPAPASPGAASGLPRCRLPAGAAVAVGAVAVQVVQVGGEAVGLRAALAACGPHPGSAVVGLGQPGP